jgi:hypothetical protein
MDARTVQVHGSARLKCHETEKQTLPSSVGRRGAPDGLAELSVTDPGNRNPGTKRADASNPEGTSSKTSLQ